MDTKPEFSDIWFDVKVGNRQITDAGKIIEKPIMKRLAQLTVTSKHLSIDAGLKKMLHKLLDQVIKDLNKGFK